MSKVLFIGDYFPHASYNAILNEKIATKISVTNELILVSSAWCNIDKVIYGDEVSLSINKPFYKRFFLDPIQMKYLNQDVVQGYLALCCKIIEKYDIKAIIYADKMQYCLLVDLLRTRFSIPIYRLIFDANIYQCLDDYAVTFVPYSLEQSEKICMYKSNSDLFHKFLNIKEDLFVDLNPFSQSLYKKVEDGIDSIAIFTNYLDQDKYDFLCKRIMNLMLPVPFFFVALEKDKNLKTLNHAIILYSEFEGADNDKVALFFENEICEQKHIAYSEIVLALSLGKSCILSKSKVLQIEQFYNIKKEKVTESLFAIMGIG